MKHDGAWTTLIQEREGYCTVTIPERYSKGKKFWIARITGKDKKYGIAREFVNGTNYCSKRLEPGIYDVCNIPRQGAADYERYFLRVFPTGEAREITRSDVQLEVDGNDTPAIPAATLAAEIPF
jgi:hypothetical protein